jgi:hypothetical protein
MLDFRRLHVTHHALQFDCMLINSCLNSPAQAVKQATTDLSG